MTNVLWLNRKKYKKFLSPTTTFLSSIHPTTHIHVKCHTLQYHAFPCFIWITGMQNHPLAITWLADIESHDCLLCFYWSVMQLLSTSNILPFQEQPCTSGSASASVRTKAIKDKWKHCLNQTKSVQSLPDQRVGWLPASGTLNIFTSNNSESSTGSCKCFSFQS